MIDRRFSAALALLLAVPAVPTVIHSYRGLTIDDGLRASAIPAMLDGMPSRATGRKPGWAESTLAAHDWIERYYRVGDEEVSLFVGRSFDPKRLYHHPELALLRGLETMGAGWSALPGRPEVPVRLLTVTSNSRRGLAAYTLLYGREHVHSPLLFQVRISASQIFSGRQPMTLLLAADRSGSPDHLSNAPALRVLAAALQAFEAQGDGD